jgi:hypothetical protein
MAKKVTGKSTPKRAVRRASLMPHVPQKRQDDEIGRAFA